MMTAKFLPGFEVRFKYDSMSRYSDYLQDVLAMSVREYDLFRDIPYYMAMEFLEDYKGMRKPKKSFIPMTDRERFIMFSAPKDKWFIRYNKDEVMAAIDRYINPSRCMVDWMDSCMYWTAIRIEKLCGAKKEEYQ